MKIKNLLISFALLMISSAGFAQSIGDMITGTQGQREKEMWNKDDRHVTFGVYGDYTLTPGEKLAYSNTNQFITGIGVGFSVFVPVFSSGDGSNIGDTNGDITFSAGWKGWVSDSDNLNAPDWNTYTGLVGFRLGLGDLLFVEPQGGYTYGTYSNSYFKNPSNKVSGVTYGARAGFTLIRGFDLYVIGQTISTQLFTKPLDLGFGFDYHF